MRETYSGDIEDGGEKELKVGLLKEAREGAPENGRNGLGSAPPGPVAPAEEFTDEESEEKNNEKREEGEQEACVLKHTGGLIA